jgi:uncharacterized protein YjiS (DUF1127 family)
MRQMAFSPAEITMSLTLTHNPECGSAAREAGWSGLARRLTLAIYHQFQRASRQVAIRRARRELLDLPDFMLADLGISRSEVDSVVRHGRADATRLPRGRA